MNLKDVIKRLKESKQACESRDYCLGESFARTWITEKDAPWDQIQGVAFAYERLKDRLEEMFNDDNPIRQYCCGWPGWIHEIAHPINRYASDSDIFLELVFGEYWDEYADNTEIARGFIAGVWKFWLQNKQLIN